MSTEDLNNLSNPREIKLLGVRFHDMNVERVHQTILQLVKENRKEMILNVNIHCLNLAYTTLWLKQMLNRAYRVFCDGDGVRWGVFLSRQKVPPKITYDRWIWQLAGMCETESVSLFLLGAKPGIPEDAAHRLIERFPRLKIVGTHHGYFRKSGSENEALIAKINLTCPDILVVGFGMPIQEKWILENADKIQTHVFLTGGAVLDYVSGRAQRAPRWMIRCHLEWFFRFLMEPRRLFKRYFIGNFIFMFRVLREVCLTKGNADK